MSWSHKFKLIFVSYDYSSGLQSSLVHTDGGLTNSDWFINSFIMGVYEKFFYILYRRCVKRFHWI